MILLTTIANGFKSRPKMIDKRCPSGINISPPAISIKMDITVLNLTINNTLYHRPNCKSGLEITACFDLSKVNSQREGFPREKYDYIPKE